MTGMPLKDRCEPWKAILEILQALATIGAIIAAGVWFYMQRSTKPEIKLEQTITQRRLLPSNRWLLTVDVRATNIGKVKVDLERGEVKLTKVNPTPDVPLISRPLKKLLLEPGESDQAIFESFSLSDDVKTIQMESSYPVPDSKLYWDLRSVADIGQAENRTESAVLPK
jgi:hypothetical protein